MTTATIALPTLSVQSAHPTYRYGVLAVMNFRSTASMILRVPLSGIPSNAVIASATLEVWQYTAGTGSVAATAKVNTGSWSTATTWNTKPATTTTNQATSTRSAPAAGSKWSFTVTNAVQAWVSGGAANNGFTLSTTSTTGGILRGSAATSLRPQLVVVYSLPADPPTALNPTGGAVSKNKPTLTFQVPSDTVSVQVQVDPAANSTTPGFDSGEVASTAGVVDLSTTAYAGLADGASTQFRARRKNGLGWSDWSGWVSFSRATWKALTITNPGTTSEDPSPPITATYAGTLTAWQALLLDSSGRTLNDSGWTPGLTIAYAASRSVGTSGSVTVRVRDDVTRVATVGDPDYLEITQAFTVAASGTPSVVTGLSASQDGTRPWVTLAATRSAIPDEVAVYRDGFLVGRVPGLSVFSGTTMTFVDRTAPMNVTASYVVKAIVNGAFSNDSNSTTLTPRCRGIWLADPDDGTEAVLWGDEDPEQTQPELAAEHRPINGTARVVRRRLSRYPREGGVAGQLFDVLGIPAAASEAALRAWVDQDAGHVYRLVLGNQNDPVILGNITFAETSVNGRERILNVSADWWWQG